MSGFIGQPFTTADKIASLRREINLRRSVYRRALMGDSMKMKRFDAERELAVMMSILADYERRDRAETPQLKLEAR